MSKIIKIEIIDDDGQPSLTVTDSEILGQIDEALEELRHDRMPGSKAQLVNHALLCLARRTHLKRENARALGQEFLKRSEQNEAANWEHAKRTVQMMGDAAFAALIKRPLEPF